MSVDDALTLGQAGKRLGLDPWQLNSLYVRGLLPAPARFGRYRVVRVGELETVRRAAVAAGYLSETREVAVSA